MKKLNKNLELFYQTSITKSFQDAIQKVRKEIDLPPQGIRREAMWSDWIAKDMEKVPSDEEANYLSEKPWVSVLQKLQFFTQKIVDDFSLPDSLYNWVRYYILFDYVDKELENSHEFFGVLLANEYNTDAKMLSERMIIHKWPVLLIHPMTSKNDLIKFIEKNWKNFPNAKVQKTIKRKTYKERDALIYNMYLEHKKDIQISKEMNAKGFNVNSDHVRKIINAEKRARSK